MTFLNTFKVGTNIFKINFYHLKFTEAWVMILQSVVNFTTITWISQPLF